LARWSPSRTRTVADTSKASKVPSERTMVQGFGLAGKRPTSSAGGPAERESIVALGAIHPASEAPAGSSASSGRERSEGVGSGARQ
jgi:hypothetical protein